MRTKLLRGALIFVDGFAAVSALFGGLELETGWPFRFPTSMLHGTPFSDYVLPGLLLGILVGGSAALATVATIRSASAGALWSFIGGSIMTGWIVAEVLILDLIANTDHAVYQGFWLQAFYFVIGVVMMLLALGVAPALPRTESSARRPIHTAAGLLPFVRHRAPKHADVQG